MDCLLSVQPRKARWAAHYTVATRRPNRRKRPSEARRTLRGNGLVNSRRGVLGIGRVQVGQDLPNPRHRIKRIEKTEAAGRRHVQSFMEWPARTESLITGCCAPTGPAGAFTTALPAPPVGTRQNCAISLDSDLATIHDRVRGVAGAFDRESEVIERRTTF